MTADTTGPGSGPVAGGAELTGSAGAEENAAFGLPAGPVLRHVGPGRNRPELADGATALAADSYFAGNLLTLWHAVSEAGGAVGFVPPVERSRVAPLAAAAVSAVRDGVLMPVVVTVGRELVAAAFLQPGRGDLVRHTGDITRVMVDPRYQGTGIGRVLMQGTLDLAAALGLERVQLTVRDGSGADGFYSRFGFREYGRRPGWIRVGAADDRDEIMMWAPVPAPRTA